MNDYEMMNQRIDQLREELARLNKKKANIQSLIDDVMAELLDTRRQITRADKLRVKMGYFTEKKSDNFKAEALEQMLKLSSHISDIEWRDGSDFQSVTWMGIPKPLASVDCPDV